MNQTKTENPNSRAQKLQSHAADILITAYEGNMTGAWANSKGDYRWDDENNTASVTLVEIDTENEYFIDETMIVRFIEKAATDATAFLGQLSKRLVAKLVMVWADPDYDLDLDAVDADCIVQMVLLGEVEYG